MASVQCWLLIVCIFSRYCFPWTNASVQYRRRASARARTRACVKLDAVAMIYVPIFATHHLRDINCIFFSLLYLFYLWKAGEDRTTSPGRTRGLSTSSSSGYSGLWKNENLRRSAPPWAMRPAIFSEICNLMWTGWLGNFKINFKKSYFLMCDGARAKYCVEFTIEIIFCLRQTDVRNNFRKQSIRLLHA